MSDVTVTRSQGDTHTVSEQQARALASVGYKIKEPEKKKPGRKPKED